MTQDQAFEILKTGRNVFLTGAAGSGKTYLLNRYIEYMKKRGRRVAVTASTGIAATHIGGMTIHSWCGMGISDTLSEQDISRLGRNERLAMRTISADTLLIDEISMLDAGRLSLVDRILRAMRGSFESFGGMQVILCGDFFQLPPVGKAGKPRPRFAFEGEAWEKINPAICYLEEQYRQNDRDYCGILNMIRSGKADREVALKLRKRIDAEITGILPARLFSHNEDVDAWNMKELSRIEEESHRYEMVSRGRRELVYELKKGCLAPEALELKQGAIVMFVKNNFEAGYVNGTMGTVIGFEDEGYPLVRTRSGRVAPAFPESWRVEDDGRIAAEIKQVPLRLAWAITIHKSQGMSLDAADIDLRGAFEPGMGYVALSRVRAYSGLRLRGFNEMALVVSGLVLEFDNTLKESSRRLEEEIKQGRKDKKDEEKIEKKKSYSMQEVRKAHPRA